MASVPPRPIRVRRLHLFLGVDPGTVTSSQKLNWPDASKRSMNVFIALNQLGSNVLPSSVALARFLGTHGALDFLNTTSDDKIMTVIVNKVLGWIEYNIKRRIPHIMRDEKSAKSFRAVWPIWTEAWLAPHWDGNTDEPDGADASPRPVKPFVEKPKPEALRSAVMSDLKCMLGGTAHEEDGQEAEDEEIDMYNQEVDIYNEEVQTDDTEEEVETDRPADSPSTAAASRSRSPVPGRTSLRRSSVKAGKRPTVSTAATSVNAATSTLPWPQHDSVDDYFESMTHALGRTGISEEPSFSPARARSVTTEPLAQRTVTFSEPDLNPCVEQPVSDDRSFKSVKPSSARIVAVPPSRPLQRPTPAATPRQTSPATPRQTFTATSGQTPAVTPRQTPQEVLTVSAIGRPETSMDGTSYCHAALPLDLDAHTLHEIDLLAHDWVRWQHAQVATFVRQGLDCMRRATKMLHSEDEREAELAIVLLNYSDDLFSKALALGTRPSKKDVLTV